MIVEIIHCNDGDKKFIQILFDGRQNFYIEEDLINWQNNTLSKNFAGYYMIKPMLEKVYIAGQKNEPVEFKVNIYEQR